MRRSILTLLLLCLAAPQALAQGDKGDKDKGDKTAKEAKDVIDFQKQIWPILEKSCLDCHSTAHAGADGKLKKPKGGVVLDSKEGITTSKKGKLVVAKKPEDSLIYGSISLPADDDDRMPPKKKGPPLAKEQIELIQKWIAQGADLGKWTGKAKEGEDKGAGDKSKDKDKPGEKPSDKPKDKPGDKPKGKSGGDPLLQLQKGLKALPEATLAAFADGPFRVASIGDESPLLAVSCSGHTDEVDDQAVALLRPIASHVTEVDLGRSRVGDDGCAIFAAMPRLTSLDLRQTLVGDHGAAALAPCSELRTLNLFGTKVGDYGMAALAGLKKLEHIYLWQTEVSAEAAVRLRDTLPALQIVMADALPEPMAEGAGGKRNRK